MVTRPITPGKKRGQMKIQQMAFMIVAVFFFFVLVGLAFAAYEYQTLQKSFANLQAQQAISSLQTVTDMPEMTCGYLCVDEDKLLVMSTQDYGDFWPVASIDVYRVHPSFSNTSVIDCPGVNCNHYYVRGSGTGSGKRYTTYVNICKKIEESNAVYDKCEIGKLLVEART